MSNPPPIAYASANDQSTNALWSYSASPVMASAPASCGR
jgi:hypothetical protein